MVSSLRVETIPELYRYAQCPSTAPVNCSVNVWCWMSSAFRWVPRSPARALLFQCPQMVGFPSFPFPFPPVIHWLLSLHHGVLGPLSWNTVSHTQSINHPKNRCLVFPLVLPLGNTETEPNKAARRPFYLFFHGASPLQRAWRTRMS